MTSAAEATCEEFRSRVRAWEAAFSEDDENASSSNEILTEIDRWVDSLGDEAPNLLGPALDDENPLIRSTAASYLINCGAREKSLAVLREVAENDEYDIAASMASARLRLWWDPLESTCRHASLSIL